MNDRMFANRGGGRRPGYPLLLLAGGAAVLVALMILSRRLPSGRLPVEIRLDGATMATVYGIKVVVEDASPGERERILRIVEGELEGVDAVMSRYREGSTLDRFNRSRDTAARPIPADLAGLLLLARSISVLSGGAFDVTVGPLVRLWGFDDRRRLALPPEEEAVEAARERVGFDLLEVDPDGPTARKLHPDLDIDLSSIAKGFGVDRVSRALEAAGYRDHLVEIGGEVRAAGHGRRGAPWRIGIEKPLDDRREILEVVPLSDMSMATSGDYRDFYMLEGRRVSHTIDPRSGRPVDHGLASVTVLDPSCARADALATALMVLGPEEGPALAEREGLSALFMIRREDETFERRATAAFETR